MKFRLLATIMAVLASAHTARAQAMSNNRCVYPTGLREEMARKYAGTRPIRWEDLDEYDRQYFQKGMGARCPGLLKVNFYGDGKPTWAIGLVKGAGSNRRVELVVARQLGKEWEMRSLLTLDGADSPVIMSQGPGEYREDPGGNHDSSQEPGDYLYKLGILGVHLDRRPSKKDHALTMTHRSILLRCRLIALSAWICQAN